jgi:Kef-type K+ transport system membrane component KefB
MDTVGNASQESTSLDSARPAADAPGGGGRTRRYIGAYAALVALPAAAAVLFLLRGGGADSGGSHPQPAQGIVYHLLIATVTVVALGAIGGAVAARLGQPRVVSELLIGVALGPSLFGALAPDAQRWFFPAGVVPYLDALAQFGVVFFMFLIGAELRLDLLRRSGGRALVVGHATIALPFAAGLAVAQLLRGTYAPPGISATAFLLFVGVSFAITAFPVLAWILRDRGLLDTPIGAEGIAAAGIGDVTAWCVLAVVIAVIRGTSAVGAAVTVALVAVFAAVMLLGVRPVLRRLDERARHRREIGLPMAAALICVVLLSALITERMGVHPIFGAFLAGVVMPRNSRLVTELTTKIEGVTLWVMLPLFFVTVGLHVRIIGFTGAMWLTALLILAVAVVAKLAGTAGAARAAGASPRDAFALGVMMNCRGLTELVVLNLGLQLGVLNRQLFAMFVVMALVTTAMTQPLLRLAAHGPAPAGPDDGRSADALG